MSFALKKEKRKGEVVGNYVTKAWIVECMLQTDE